MVGLRRGIDSEIDSGTRVSGKDSQLIQLYVLAVSIRDVYADTYLIDSIMLAFRLLILVAFLTICSWSSPIDVYDDNDELVLNQIDQPANSCDPPTLKSQDSVVGSELARIDVTAADSDIQLRDLTATTQLDDIASEDNSPIAFGDNKSPQRSFCPTVPQAVPLRQMRPGKDLCPALTDALCCHDKPTKSKPRPSKAPLNRYSNIQRITDFNPHRLEVAPDRDDEDRYDFEACVKCTISPCIECHVSFLGVAMILELIVTLDDENPFKSWCLNVIQCCEAFGVSASLRFIPAP